MFFKEHEQRLFSSRAKMNQPQTVPTDWSDWIAAAERLWYFRRRILVFLLIGGLFSALLCFRLPKYESTVQIMPPDSSSSGLAALALPALSKMPGLAGLASDLLGAKNSTAVFLKVLGSRTVQDDLITRF